MGFLPGSAVSQSVALAANRTERPAEDPGDFQVRQRADQFYLLIGPGLGRIDVENMQLLTL